MGPRIEEPFAEKNALSNDKALSAAATRFGVQPAREVLHSKPSRIGHFSRKTSKN
jgi:hypothetical protein